MTKAKDKRTEKVGTLVEAKDVVRPDGSELKVSGGVYVLDVPGMHVVDGEEIEAK